MVWVIGISAYFERRVVCALKAYKGLFDITSIKKQNKYAANTKTIKCHK